MSAFAGAQDASYLFCGSGVTLTVTGDQRDSMATSVCPVQCSPTLLLQLRRD